MRFDPERAEAWYQAISEFLEGHATEEDGECPGALVTALCKVLVDAAEGLDETDERKLEVVARAVARELGFDSAMVVAGKDFPRGNSN